MDIAFARFDSATLLSLGYLARTCKPQRSSEWYRKHGMTSTSDRQNQKSHAAVEKCLAAMAKQNKKAIQHIFS